MLELLGAYEIGGMTVRYMRDPARGCVGMEWIPTGLATVPSQAETRPLESLVQVKLLGEPYPGAFAQGHTMRNAPSLDAFAYVGQQVERADDLTTVRTTLRSAVGHVIEHCLAWHAGDSVAQVYTTFRNESADPVTLEMLSSFSVGGITPFHGYDAPGRLRVHRFRSVWSAEGRLDTQTIEQLHLEKSWSGAGAFSERFGQLGTMPVRHWFPFVAVEDVAAGVVWGAQLAWAGSWQMEIYRKHDDVAISGGLADREFGHWMKKLLPGEQLETPPATVACVYGDLDELCDRLTAVQQRALRAHPAVEQDLPIIFNEWCTTWGDPQHDKVVAIADRLQGSGTRYLVIDAGWYKAEGNDWSSGHGDWVPSAKLFPGGLAQTAAAIRERGLIPGLWFEMETVGSQSTAFSLVDHLLKRDGLPVTVRERRFWDLTDPWAVRYLTQRVIDLLEQGGFGYLKVDYNETLGLGCDHPDSLGEGLRQQVLASYRFFDLIRARLPGLVVENCASGGHRLEPSMLARTAMSSFSDAHEAVEIPIIAANLHQLMLPRQSQIWAVLREADSRQRLAYSLAATFLGRMCLSGDVATLSAEQWAVTRHAMALYALAAPIIKQGRSRRFGERNQSWRYPTGWQAVRREAADGSALLVVIHFFAQAPAHIAVPLLPGTWRLADQFPSPCGSLVEGALRIDGAGDFSAAVIRLERIG